VSFLVLIFFFLYLLTRPTLQQHNIPVARGSEIWAVGMHPNGKKGLQAKDIIIKTLHHCGGANWQPELWISNELIKMSP
jgi:hypothetical protein